MQSGTSADLWHADLTCGTCHVSSDVVSD